MRPMGWDRFDRWHRLFDALCDRRGHVDNAGLASQLCRRQGRNAREDFSAAEKSLRNWRLGRHLPLRRNFILLSELLGVAEDPDLVRRWNRLYTTARGREPLPDDDERTAHAASPAPSALLAKPRLLWITAAAAAALLAAAGIRWTTTDPYAHLPMIGYNARVVMAVGESRLIHGDRGDCDGGLLPGWAYTQQRVPASRLGSFSDGGLARKMSNFCNTVVPVRAVRFTAGTAGVEEIRLLDDFVKIVVVDPRESRLE